MKLRIPLLTVDKTKQQQQQQQQQQKQETYNSMFPVLS